MLRMKAVFVGFLLGVFAACSPGEFSDGTKVLIIYPDLYDVSPPLSQLAQLQEADIGRGVREAEAVRPIPHMRFESAGQVVDPVVQNAIGTGPNIPSPITTFEGMGVGLSGFTVQSAPPDTDGDIGPNHYVQIVNSSVTIFNRSGTPVLGPVLTKTFFANFNNSACQNTNDGDGVVRYDRIADRWVISQFSVNGGNGPFFQCIAVSTSPDPTGAYNRYQFSFNGFNDYPKMGLWPDAYYFTYNMFPNNTFAGARVCAVDRAKMITGAVATQQCFDTSNQFGGLLAADLDGATLPPVGEPNTLIALDTNAIDVFKFHVDFVTPANSTFTGPTTIPVAAFTPLCNGAACVVQPGTTNKLDSLADRMMNRAVYHRFAAHEAMVFSHAVAAGTGGGVRFYELRNINVATPTLFQQGTYAPDDSFRWMSSMAFDQDGNIGLCFTISSSAINPGIRYTGRLVGDALGTMGQGEATITSGTGSQTGTLTRWGSYASINIDPTDDCTFWCTQEYMGASGTFNWHTRVGTFKFASCGQGDQLPTVSITSPTNSSTANGTIPVSANAADADGTVVNVKFDLPDGTSVTDTSSPFATTFDTTRVPDGAGQVIRATATDNQGATATTTVTVTIANNLPPTVSITSPTSDSTVSGTITVSANASDTDGTVVNVKFDLPDGTSVTDTSPPFATTFDTARVPDGAGQLIRATATDNQGATATTTVAVTVANSPGPTVSITSPTSGSTVSGTITVSASASDTGSTVAATKFDLPDGTSVTDTTSPFSTTFDTRKVVNGSGYVIRATATNNNGATATTTVTVTIANNLPPTVSITSPTSGSTLSGTITVSANASDADGSVASVKFDLPDGTSVTDTTSPFSTTFDTPKVPNGAGQLIRATATDNQGATATTTVTVTIANNLPPTLSITSPTSGSTVSGTITVSANASDADGSVASVRFDLPDGTSITDTTSPFSTTFDTTRVVNGNNYTIQATASDDRGATDVSAVTVSVANSYTNILSAASLPIQIPDDDPIGITSSIPVSGNGDVMSLSLSLNITHPFRGDLVVTLISPLGAQFVVSSRQGGSADNIIIDKQMLLAFVGQSAVGTWKLRVQDLAIADTGTLDSWSMAISVRCN